MPVAAVKHFFTTDLRVSRVVCATHNSSLLVEWTARTKLHNYLLLEGSRWLANRGVIAPYIPETNFSCQYFTRKLPLITEFGSFGGHYVISSRAKFVYNISCRFAFITPLFLLLSLHCTHCCVYQLCFIQESWWWWWWWWTTCNTLLNIIFTYLKTFQRQ